MAILDQVSPLLALINQAARTLEAEYKKGQGHVPSLDDTSRHPLDGRGACTQLCATLARPNHTITNALEPSCLHVALAFRIPDILQKKPSGMHVTEISQQCGVEPSKLARILRLLSAQHCFREVERDTFANNRLSVQILAANPLHSFGLHMTEDAMQAGIKLAEILADDDWGHSFVPEHSAWNRYTKQSKPMFDFWEETPEMRAYGDRFGVAMLGWGAAVEADSVITGYPWKDLKSDASVCDLGGGVGLMTMHLARAYPNLQLKLQDLPDRMMQARDKIWPAQCPDALEENRIEFKAIDFFTESPIEGCDVYYVNENILHAWPHTECGTILKGVRKSMKPGSRVLIHEYILQTAGSNDQADVDRRFKQAPAPLLSNYGAGRIRQYNLDLTLMALINSQERTLDEYVQLGEEAGLKFAKLWEFGDMSVVELCASDDD
ncbi:S-adenosyl-L-methionine-dependent methyltransferase [Mycena sp. CBHHK59/15]|nr:S-adenosyl-L-methionine-dependent methyltransferase [Mycena sp. CBHHK59/15]